MQQCSTGVGWYTDPCAQSRNGLQGPVEHIWITEVSLGRTKSAKKLVKGVARFWSTFRLKLPLTVRGLRIELREGRELPAWAVRCGDSALRRAPCATCHACACAFTRSLSVESASYRNPEEAALGGRHQVAGA